MEGGEESSKSTSYGSFDSLEEKGGTNIDLADVKNYFKHKTPWGINDILKSLWEAKWIFLFGFVIEIFLLLIGLLDDEWKEMPWGAWFSIEVTVLSLCLLIGNYLTPGLIFLGAMTLCYGFQIINSTQAFEGFSNTGVITIGVMFIIAKTVELTDVLRYLVKYVLRNPKRVFVAQIRLTVPVAILSAFINNTPIVAMMIPVVQNWGRQCGLSVSQLLIPLSYAAILGGTCTIIGTSTNLVVQGLAYSEDPTMVLGFFEIGMAGIPLMFMSLIYIYIFSRCLLPTTSPEDPMTAPRPTHEEGNPDQRRNYTIQLTVTKGSSMIGKTISEGGINQLPGVTLFKIQRMAEHDCQTEEEISISDSAGIDGDTIVQEGDMFFFSGMLRDMYLVYQLDGMVPSTTQISKITGKRNNRVILEVVLSPQAPFIGKTVRESKFRTQYNAVIIGVQRYGVRLTKCVGDITLKGGDTLLVEATQDFLKYHRPNSEFALVSEILRGESTTPRRISLRLILVITLALVMILLSAFQWVELLTCALFVACLYVILEAITWDQALQSIQGDTLLIIATAFGLGNALNVSGAAIVIANTLISVFSVGGRIGVLFGLYASTALLSAVISNSATVTLMWPIAVQFAASTGISLKCVTYTLMLAGSCSFATPVGYQTNLMVMGPGGYTTNNFLKFGIPLTLLNLLVGVVLCYVYWADDF